MAACRRAGWPDHPIRRVLPFRAPSLSEFSTDSLVPAWSAQRIHKVAGLSIDLMTSESLWANLIERYVGTCGLRFFRGQHDGEYFLVADARPRRLRVHLEISPSFGDVLIIRVTPSCLFPVADRPWLTHFADAWNQQNREVTAIVHGSSDPQRIGVSARRSQWIRESISFEDFASFADRTIAAAIDLFAELTPVVELPSTAQPLLRDAG
jgi:hypothetical protein